MKYLKFIRSFLSFLGASHWWEGCEKLSLMDRVYNRRLGIKTSYKIAKQIWLN